MVVIIPHSTEELKLIRLQKELIARLNKDGNIWIRNYPLWIELPDCIFQNNIPETTAELKDFSKKIDKVTLEKIVFQKNEVFISVKLELISANSAFMLELPLISNISTSSIDTISTSSVSTSSTTIDTISTGSVSTGSVSTGSTTTTTTTSTTIDTVLTSLKVFRLGLSHIDQTPASSLHNSGTSIQSGKTCTYVLQNTVWFKKSK